MVDNITNENQVTETPTQDVSVVEPDVQDDIMSIKEVQEDEASNTNKQVADGTVHVYRSNEMPTDVEITCKVKFNVYNGERIPDKGDLIKFWEGKLEPDINIIEGINASTIKGFRILELLSASEISTGYHLEGITIVAKAVPVIEN